MKNDISMSIRSLSISNDVFRINKFVDNISNLYKQDNAFVFRFLHLDVYKQFVDVFLVDDKTHWACQIDIATFERI